MALSLYNDIVEVIDITKPNENTELMAMFRDARRFILKNRSIVEMAPLQVYDSALVFCPKKSVIKQRFSDQAPSWIKSLTIVEEDWNSSLQVLEGHAGRVNALAFSPHGRLLISGHGNGAIKLWDPSTGVWRGTLEGHSKSVGILGILTRGRHPCLRIG